MARAKGRGAPAFVAHTEGPKLLDLPCVLLEIILLLPLKSR